MYTVKNYRTKKELKADVEAGVKVRYFQPGPFGGMSLRMGPSAARVHTTLNPTGGMPHALRSMVSLSR